MADSNDFPLPPANFTFLVESILMQTQVQLGLLKFGEEGEDEQEPNLPVARHSIDMLAVLQEKTRGNLTTEEARVLENGLTELRFRYVQVAEELKRKDAPEAPAAAAEEGPRIVLPDGGKGTKTS
jgi:hypothetical protein